MIALSYNEALTPENIKSTMKFYNALTNRDDNDGADDDRDSGFFLPNEEITTVDESVSEHQRDNLKSADFVRPTYILVDDLERETTRAKDLGATIIQWKTEVSGSGAFSLIADPIGGVVSLWQKSK